MRGDEEQLKWSWAIALVTIAIATAAVAHAAVLTRSKVESKVVSRSGQLP